MHAEFLDDEWIRRHHFEPQHLTVRFESGRFYASLQQTPLHVGHDPPLPHETAFARPADHDPLPHEIGHCLADGGATHPIGGADLGFGRDGLARVPFPLPDLG